MLPSIYHTVSPNETFELGSQLAGRLRPGMSVFLIGNLGAGKTHFTKGIAKGLGIEGTIKSPTFTYVHSYSIQSDKPESGLNTPFYHYDLYRLNTGDAFHTIGLEETLHDPLAINVVEWADRLEKLTPQNHVLVQLEAAQKSHKIRIEFHDSHITPASRVEEYWQDWSTPLHVRAHCQKVAEVALSFAKAFLDKNIVLDLNLIQTAALLHDLCRVCDFREMDRSKFHETISEEKWQKWLKQRQKFKGMHHADIAYNVLKEAYPSTAEVIRLHNSLHILDEPEQYHQLEIALVYYADKRVKHDQVVPLAERHRDGQQRNSQNNPEQDQQHIQAQLKQYELEKKLFSLIDLKPEELK